MMRLLMLLTLLLAPALAQTSQTIAQNAQRTLPGSVIRAVAPDPLSYLASIDRRLRTSGLAEGMLWLGGAVLFIGLIKRSYDLTLSGSELEHPKLWLVAAIYASLLSTTLGSGSFEVRGLLQHLWQNAYAWSATRFDNDIEQKVLEAQDSLVLGVSRVASAAGIVAIPYVTKSALSAGAGLLRSPGAPVVGGQLSEGAAATAPMAGKSTFRYLGLAQQSTYPLLSLYALGIMLSGLAVVMVCYLLPVAIAFLIWGYQNLALGCMTVFLTALLTVVFLPPTMALAIDVAFVQSMKNVERITQNLDAQVNQAAALTQQAKDRLNGASQERIEACLNALNGDPEALSQPVCQRENTGNIWAQLGNQIGDVLRQMGNQIEQSVLRPLRDIAILAIGSVVFLIIGLILGGALLAQVPSLLGSIIGGGIGSVSTAWQASRINLIPPRGR